MFQIKVQTNKCYYLWQHVNANYYNQNIEQKSLKISLLEMDLFVARHNITFIVCLKISNFYLHHVKKKTHYCHTTIATQCDKTFTETWNKMKKIHEIIFKYLFSRRHITYNWLLFYFQPSNTKVMPASICRIFIFIQ